MIILHGEDANKSYSRLIVLTEGLKSKQIEIVTHDAQEIDITHLRQEIGSSGLFGSLKCFVIKNLLSGTKSKNKDKIVEVLSQETGHEIILWENKGLTATILKKFPKATVESFSISPIIFKFLDSLRPQNTKNILLSWKNLLKEGTEPEFVFTMTVRQIKLLIQVKSGPQYLKLAPYPARLISQQATYFTLEHLLDLYQKLYEIDLKIKTGTGGNSIDNLLTNFFQKI
jgi:DNA polymerase III delta subunit